MLKKNKTIIKVTIGLASILGIILLILFTINSSTSPDETAYGGDFDNTVVLSERLVYILTDNFHKYTQNAIQKALDDYFLPIYPSGVGISIVSYTNDTQYSMRIIDSYGAFHTLTVRDYDNSTELEIRIDETKKTYTIESPDREFDD